MSELTSEVFEVVGSRGRKFSIVLPRTKGKFAAFVQRRLIANNRYDQLLHVGVLTLDYLKGSGTLVDVGANIGLLSIPAAVHGSRVIAIELLPENCLYLNLAILENRLSNIAVFQLAAGADRGLVSFAGSEAWGHVVPTGEGAQAVMMPLDDVVELANQQQGGRRARFVKAPVLIKIDTEGYELAVLKGASTTIARFNPDFIVESIMVEGRDDESDRQSLVVKTYLEEMGYCLYLHRDGRLVPRAASDPQEGHVSDFFASRRRYRDGERIGRFTVGPLDFADKLTWVTEEAEFHTPEHRLHAVGVIARWEAEGGRSARLDNLRQRLLDDADPRVAEAAARLAVPHG
jgi:FkbM family methyltransferase